MDDRQENVANMMNAEVPSEATASSDMLKRKIIRDIASQDGWMSFAGYMERLMYEPLLGYYNGG